MSAQHVEKKSQTDIADRQTRSLVERLPESWQNIIKKGPLSWWLALICGVLVPLAFAPFNTYNSLFSYLLFLPLTVFLFQLLHTDSAKEAFFKGWLFGIGLFAVGVSWLYVAIHDFGAAHWSLAGIFTGLFIAFLALLYALLGWSLFKVKNRLKSRINEQNNSAQNRLVLFYLPVLWVVFEWIRGWLLTGFPWILVGYPLIETPLSAYAPIFGIFGLSFLVVFISALLLARIKPLSIILTLSILIGVGSLLGEIQWSETQGKPLSVALIQGNVNQLIKWDRWQLEKTKQKYVSLSQDQWQTNDIIVWPENAIPTFYYKLQNSFYHHLALQARQTQTELITGLPVFDEEKTQYYNAMTNLGGIQGFYHKTHLVPFGEYVPLASLIRGWIQFFNLPMSGFSAGESEQELIEIKGYKVVVTLCYEDVFAQDVIRQIPQAQFMLNLSNNGWYGNSFAPHQHLEMARMRALETSRELIRSTTSGISALVDSKGQIMVQGPQFEAAVVNGKIQPRTGITPYVFWGNYPVLILFILTGLLLTREKY